MLNILPKGFSSLGFLMNNLEKQLRLFKFLTIVLSVLLVCVAIFSLTKNKKTSSQKNSLNLSEKAVPISETKVNKSFDFLIKKGAKDKFSINIEKASLVKLVTSKGKPMVPKPGEVFLLLYLKLENNLTVGLNINSQNYFRLIDKEGKRYAPDFYNTSLQVLPISVKSDNLGFVIKEGEKNIQIQVGEVDGEKKTVEIQFN